MNKVRAFSVTPVEDTFIKEMKVKNNWGMSYIIHRALDDFRLKNEKPATAKVKDRANDIQEERNEILKKTGILPELSSKQAKAEQAGKFICEQLAGTITEDGLHCAYNMYGNVTDSRRITPLKNPLTHINEYDVERQYDSGKDSYLAFCAKKNLDPYKL